MNRSSIHHKREELHRHTQTGVVRLTRPLLSIVLQSPLGAKGVHGLQDDEGFGER